MTTIHTDEPGTDLSPESLALTEAGILIVDEDPAFQLGLKTFLKEYVGFEKVFTARNGKEAIELIGKEPSIELLTVDFQMPVMDGIEMLKLLQFNAPRPLGVTMITGFPSEELKREYAGLSSSRLLARHLLSKPVEFEKLEPIILESYQEVKKAHHLTGAMQGIGNFPGEEGNAIAIAASNRELLARFESVEEKLGENNRTIEQLSKRLLVSICTNLITLLLVVLIAIAAWQGGLFFQ
jgi:YesN/AraC family two-component response regulator